MVKHVNIIKTLLKATKIDNQQDDEARGTFLTRLYEAAHELESDVWEALPEVIQNWVNDATTAGNDDEEIPDPDAKPAAKAKNGADESLDDNAEDSGKDEPEDEDDDDETESDDGALSGADEVEAQTEENDDVEASTDSGTTTKKPKKATAKAAPAKKAVAAKKEKAAKPAKKAGTSPRGNGGTGAQTQIKLMMLKDPNISTEDLIDRLGKKGLKPTKVAVTSIRSGMRHTMRVMADAGVLHHSIKFGS